MLDVSKGLEHAVNRAAISFETVTVAIASSLLGVRAS
jgi:hypothetical protein